MGCEDRRLTLSLLVDGTPAGVESGGVFAHLEGCADCRMFFDTLLAMRAAAKQDHELALREAEEFLPARPPRPAMRDDRATASGPNRWLRHAGRAFVAPVAFALLLLAAGIAIGMNLQPRAEQPAAAPPAAPPTRDGVAVVYMCSMPEYEVLAKSLPPARR